MAPLSSATDPFCAYPSSFLLISTGMTSKSAALDALKHGFQGEEEGEILVSYDAQDSGWHLSVSDNGSGAQEESGEAPHTGLGTSIVEALAHQLNATVHKSGGPQGTTDSIIASAATA